MRTTIHVSDETGEAIRALAADAGISQSEWLRRVIEAACVPSAYPAHTAAYPDAYQPARPADEERAELERAREDLAAAATRIAVLEAEARKDGEHIANLLRSLATVEGLARRALPAAATAPAAAPVEERPRAIDRLRAWLRR